MNIVVLDSVQRILVSCQLGGFYKISQPPCCTHGIG
uniref:Predicted protein n=1 Tax=Hordeum vulgare subsp. vulgare TaxID=112509 RepID=F2ELG8_HORVV|nr:predicted protein [Hordeum vulgare subsp. vulgare]